jgi:hypothetical protein
VATAKDEVSGEAVGTTGAVLTVGDELRPTGSDRALLARIASMTGGKVRDTLAGLFEDRGARRFAYTPLATRLVLLAAIAMLLGVASRRLGVPDVAAAWAARRRSKREASARDQAERVAEAARQHRLAVIEQQRLNEALLARKARATALGGQQPQGIFEGMAHPPAQAGPPPIARGVPGPPQAQAPPPAQPGERPLTVAEKLALRRRERK